MYSLSLTKLSTLSKPSSKLSKVSLISSLFQLNSHQLPSNIPEKSGNIINTVGKSVNLLTISSNCLLAHDIKKSGKASILFICIFNTSEKFDQSNDEKSSSTEISLQAALVNNVNKGSQVKSFSNKSKELDSFHECVSLIYFSILLDISKFCEDFFASQLPLINPKLSS
jgi:hypothetical protein